jgi:hypothetical protein
VLLNGKAVDGCDFAKSPPLTPYLPASVRAYSESTVNGQLPTNSSGYRPVRVIQSPIPDQMIVWYSDTLESCLTSNRRSVLP